MLECEASEIFYRKFGELTEKQHEVMRLVADNFTSKEIAYELGVSESAVNQRIEAVRSRAGAAPRAELARVYRKYLEDRSTTSNDAAPAAEAPAGAVVQAASDTVQDDEAPDRGAAAEQAALAGKGTEAHPAGTSLEWLPGMTEQVVPGFLDGSNATLYRIAAVVVIATGIMFTAVAGLGLVRLVAQV